jgi:hypothetical protein
MKNYPAFVAVRKVTYFTFPDGSIENIDLFAASSVAK